MSFFLCDFTFYLQCDIYVVESLKHDSKKVVLILDFTKFGQVDEGNVHCFVVCVLSQGDSFMSSMD